MTTTLNALHFLKQHYEKELKNSILKLDYKAQRFNQTALDHVNRKIKEMEV